MSASDREYDIVLYGATGFVGRLVAKHLAEHAPNDIRIALAGRTASKVEKVRDDLLATGVVGAAPGGHAAPAAPVLTERETEVLRLVAK